MKSTTGIFTDIPRNSNGTGRKAEMAQCSYIHHHKELFFRGESPHLCPCPCAQGHLGSHRLPQEEGHAQPGSLGMQISIKGRSMKHPNLTSPVAHFSSLRNSSLRHLTFFSECLSLLFWGPHPDYPIMSSDFL